VSLIELTNFHEILHSRDDLFSFLYVMNERK